MKTVDDKLLYRLIVQFLIFSQGLNPELDPYIDTIRRKLKQGSNITTLNGDLLKLSKAIDQLLSSQKENSEPPPIENVPKEHCIKRLEELLTGINVPTKFQSPCKTLCHKLHQTSDDRGFENVFDQAVSLIIDINKHVQNEQQETEVFLEGISKQLSQLDQQTRIASESNLASYSDRENFNAAIHSEIDNIKMSTSNALELPALQKNITAHLQELTSKLQTYKQEEDSRLRDSQHQLHEMSQKLQDLEDEANALRKNLKLAHEKAFLDSVTGLPNRLAYNEKIDMECKFWKRYRIPISLLVWDVDHFKRINDVYGHKAGDKTLALVAQLLQSNCRETDFIARYGGEEFAMLLHNVNAEQSLATAEKIRRLIEHSDFNYHGKRVHITISCGISDFQNGDDHESVFERADQALYDSKENGRNRCTVFQTA